MFRPVTSRHAVLINGIDGLVITKLDVLDQFPEIRVCTAYRLDGKVTRLMPVDCDQLTKCQPVYESFPGWEVDTSKVKSFRDLPKNARAYLNYIEKALGVPVVMISVGKDREKTILR